MSVGHYARHVPLPALVGTPTVELDPRLYIAPPLRKQCVGWYPEWGKVRVSSVVWRPPCGLRCRGAGAEMRVCVCGGGVDRKRCAGGPPLPHLSPTSSPCSCKRVWSKYGISRYSFTPAP